MNPKTSSAGSISSKWCRSRTRLARYAPVDAVARIAEREQVVRKVAVRSDARQSVRGARVIRRPAELRLQAGDIRIQRRELVHQLAGALHDRLVAQARRRRGRIGASDEQSFDRRPSARVCGGSAQVAHDRVAAAQCLSHRRRHRGGERQVRRPEPEVARERLEQRGRHAGGDDDARDANPAAGRERLRRSCVERDLDDRRSLEQLRAARRRRPRRGRRTRDTDRGSRRPSCGDPPLASSADVGCHGAARSTAGASRPAARRAFCSRFNRRRLFRASAPPSAPGAVRDRHFTSSRRSSAAKSSAARRQI